jgi:hypothetical protein
MKHVLQTPVGVVPQPTLPRQLAALLDAAVSRCRFKQLPVHPHWCLPPCLLAPFCSHTCLAVCCSLQATTEGERVLCGYKAQCQLLAEHLQRLIAGCEARTQSLICEGGRSDRIIVLLCGQVHMCI